MDNNEQFDILYSENKERAMSFRKGGQKQSAENHAQYGLCDTAAEDDADFEALMQEIDEEIRAQKAKKGKRIVLITALSLLLLTGIVGAVLFFVGPIVIPQDINTINGCPEFYNVEFGMTVDQASKLIELEHDAIESLEGSPYYVSDAFMNSSHIIIDSDEVFRLYGIKAAETHVIFDGKYVDAVILVFDKESVSYKRITGLYTKIYGPVTAETSSVTTWRGAKTTINVYDYENYSDDGEKIIIVRYTISENSRFATLSFDGPELDPCDFLGSGNAFDKKPSYYTQGLKKGEDYSYEKYSAKGFANFEEYTLYPSFAYMGIAKGKTAIMFDKAGGEDTIGSVSYLFLLDKTNAVDRMRYIEEALTQEYGAYSSCTYTSDKYGELGVVELSFDEAQQRIKKGTQGLYGIQWKSDGRRITLGLTISNGQTYYKGSVTYTD